MKFLFDIGRRRGSVSSSSSSSLRAITGVTGYIVGNPTSMRTSVLRSTFSTAPLRNEAPSTISVRHDTSSSTPKVKVESMDFVDSESVIWRKHQLMRYSMSLNTFFTPNRNCGRLKHCSDQ